MNQVQQWGSKVIGHWPTKAAGKGQENARFI